MQSFVPGDIVTIKTNFHDDGRAPGFDEEMKKYKGRAYKVKKIYNHTHNWYTLESLNKQSTDSGVEHWIWRGE